MKVLTVRQPWASLIALGAKSIETRSWPTSYRGPLAIHAGVDVTCVRKSTRLEDRRLVLGAWDVQRDGAGLLLRGPISHPYRLPLGEIVAVVDLVDCVGIESGYPAVHEHATGNLAQEDHPRPSLGWWYCTHDGLDGYDGKASRPVGDQLPLGNFTSGGFAWMLDNVRPVRRPIRHGGAQGLRDLPPAVEAEVLERVAA